MKILTIILAVAAMVTSANAQDVWASFYSESQRTASGERFNPNALTAAHRTLPMGSHVRVTNLSNGLEVIVRINDRGPFSKKRKLDLSKGAARKINCDGVCKVSMNVVD